MVNPPSVLPEQPRTEPGQGHTMACRAWTRIWQLVRSVFLAPNLAEWVQLVNDCSGLSSGLACC